MLQQVLLTHLLSAYQGLSTASTATSGLVSTNATKLTTSSHTKDSSCSTAVFMVAATRQSAGCSRIYGPCMGWCWSLPLPLLLVLPSCFFLSGPHACAFIFISPRLGRVGVLLPARWSTAYLWPHPAEHAAQGWYLEAVLLYRTGCLLYLDAPDELKQESTRQWLGVAGGIEPRLALLAAALPGHLPPGLGHTA